jgi:hypothetical protein
LAIVAATACVHDGYPLGPAGAVDIRVTVQGPLYATDSLDADGKPSGARQSPYSSDVVLAISEGDAPAFGAFVSVRVEPPQALALSSAKGEKDGPTCSLFEGDFRCQATSDGFAKFVVTSQSDWAGPGNATIRVTWANQKSEKEITVLPAGLPSDASAFELIGLGSTDRVLAEFKALKCTTSAVPDDLGTKWREGAIRFREAYVRATPPSNAPSVIENAPVTVESLSPEAALSNDPSCAERQTRLRVLLQADGQSPKFYACFSDIGGDDIQFAVTSGQQQFTTNPGVAVDAEPRLLRVSVLNPTPQIGFNPLPIFSVEAYDANRVRTQMPVDYTVDDPTVLQLGEVTATLQGDPAPASNVSATPLATGTTKLHVTPRLLSTPDCPSLPVTVTN